MPKYQSINNNLDKFSTQSFKENNNCFLSHHTALLPYQINTPPPLHKIKSIAKYVFPVPKWHGIKVEVKHHTFLTLALDWVSGHLKGATAFPAGRRPINSLLGGPMASLDMTVP